MPSFDGGYDHMELDTIRAYALYRVSLTDITMSITNIIAAFGHSSVSDDVDDLLEQYGCKARPAGDESSVSIDAATKDLAFEFSSLGTYKDDVPGGPKSQGWFILRSVYIESKHKGDLPFNLTWDISSDDLERLIGAPVKKTPVSQTHFHGGIIIVFRFVDAKKKKIEFIRFAIKDKYHAEHFGI
jgi:hypothetical protein